MLTQFWYLWVIIVLLSAATVAAIIFAARAVSSHNAETKKQLEELKRLKLLKDKYKNFETEVLENSTPAEALEGTMAVLQSRIERADDAEAEFAAFSDPQKYVYTLNYFLEDIEAGGLSFFFKNNGDELRSVAADALKAVGYESAVSPVNTVWKMFDDSYADTTVDLDELDRTDEQFAATFDKQALIDKIKDYIIENAEALKNQG